MQTVFKHISIHINAQTIYKLFTITYLIGSFQNKNAIGSLHLFAGCYYCAYHVTNDYRSFRTLRRSINERPLLITLNKAHRNIRRTK